MSITQGYIEMTTDIPQSDVIAIASLLFALVGLLGSFFFFSLSQWLSEILANSAAWDLIRALDPERKESGARLDCYHKAKESQSWATVLSWLVITTFLGFIMYRLILLGDAVQTNSRSFISEFVIQPCFVFFIIYCLLSLFFIAVGFAKSSRITSQFESSM
jgi:hypothetical protein